MPDRMSTPSVDDRIFKSVSNDSDGDVGCDTYFWFDQTDDLIHARYEGGVIRLGHLVGLHTGEKIRFRYTHVTTNDETATGQSTDTIAVLPDDRLRLHEEWSWDPKAGSGTSVIEELTEDEYETIRIR
ncbi:MAG: hypothetical protein ABEH65_11270 [Halobacteriales archaeon]